MWQTCSLPGSSVHGISQARILEWVATSSSRGCFWPRDQAHASCISASQMNSLLLSHCASPKHTFCCFCPCHAVGMWDLSSPTRDWTYTPALEVWSLNHWTTRDVHRLTYSYALLITTYVEAKLLRLPTDPTPLSGEWWNHIPFQHNCQLYSHSPMCAHKARRPHPICKQLIPDKLLG